MKVAGFDVRCIEPLGTVTTELSSLFSHPPHGGNETKFVWHKICSGIG